jgi:hypothetical protein
MSDLDGFAGLAALLNSLLLWPIVRALKNLTSDHGKRISTLESKPKKPRKKPAR